jgi:segregation and condensation protein B
MMEISNLIPHIEALIFASEKPLTTLEITDLINNAFGFMEDKIMLDQIESAIEGILEKYKAEFYPFEVRESGGGWQFLTKKDYHKTVGQLNGEKFLKRLSTAALETLSIVAYKQPVTKSEIEAIRGVSSDYAIQKLLEKDLIVITGRNENMPGHPLVYATSKNFMDYFGLNSTEDLPKLKEVFDDSMLVAPTGVSEAGIAAAESENAEEEAVPSANGIHLNGTELTFSEEGSAEEQEGTAGEYEQETDESAIAEEAEALDEEAGEVLDEIAEEGFDEEEASEEEGFEEEEAYITPEAEEEEEAEEDSTSFKVDEDGELIIEEHNDEEEGEGEDSAEADEDETDEDGEEEDVEEEDETDEDEADEEDAEDEDEEAEGEDEEGDDEDAEDKDKDEEKK